MSSTTLDPDDIPSTADGIVEEFGVERIEAIAETDTAHGAVARAILKAAEVTDR